jgi:hypothetical protein
VRYHLPAFAAALVSTITAVAAFQPQQPKAPGPSKHEASALAPVAFLAGSWRGEHEGDLIEEIWSDPQGSQIIGCFRWMDAQRRPVMLELLTVSREGEDTLLRLRHFDAKMTPWPSEADGPIVLRLDSTAPHKAVFRPAEGEKRLGGVSYELPAAGELKITVEFPPEGGRPPLVLTLERAKQN